MYIKCDQVYANEPNATTKIVDVEPKSAFSDHEKHKTAQNTKIVGKTLILVCGPSQMCKLLLKSLHSVCVISRFHNNGAVPDVFRPVHLACLIQLHYISCIHPSNMIIG